MIGRPTDDATQVPEKRHSNNQNRRCRGPGLDGFFGSISEGLATPSLHKSADTGILGGPTGSSRRHDQPVCYSMDSICRSGATFNPKVARSRLARPTAKPRAQTSRTWEGLHGGGAGRDQYESNRYSGAKPTADGTHDGTSTVRTG